MSSRPHYFASDDVIYAKNAAGHYFLTTLETDLPSGFMREVARTAADKELVWAKISAQEKREAEQMTEALYKRRVERIEAMRSALNQRKLSVECSQVERDFIRAGLEWLDRKEDALNRFSAYGLAAMQETSAPLPPSTTQKVTVPDAPAT